MALEIPPLRSAVDGVPLLLPVEDSVPEHACGGNACGVQHLLGLCGASAGAAHEHDVTVDAFACVVPTCAQHVEWNVVGPRDVRRFELRRGSHIDYQSAVGRIEQVAQVGRAESSGSCRSHGAWLPGLRDDCVGFSHADAKSAQLTMRRIRR
jgi:hypothetical protein